MAKKKRSAKRSTKARLGPSTKRVAAKRKGAAFQSGVFQPGVFQTGEPPVALAGVSSLVPDNFLLPAPVPITPTVYPDSHKQQQ